MERLTIGKAAKMAGISTDTIRYYQRLGLLPDTERLESGYRVF
ncbi:MAG: heavy metal-responsive transcriptional regulator, partial [Nitrospirae bacterium CG08_land_8_20_14_0_20_52_24]